MPRPGNGGTLVEGNHNGGLLIFLHLETDGATRIIDVGDKALVGPGRPEPVGLVAIDGCSVGLVGLETVPAGLLDDEAVGVSCGREIRHTGALDLPAIGLAFNDGTRLEEAIRSEGKRYGKGKVVVPVRRHLLQGRLGQVGLGRGIEEAHLDGNLLAGEGIAAAEDIAILGQVGHAGRDGRDLGEIHLEEPLGAGDLFPLCAGNGLIEVFAVGKGLEGGGEFAVRGCRGDELRGRKRCLVGGIAEADRHGLRAVVGIRAIEGYVGFIDIRGSGLDGEGVDGFGYGFLPAGRDDHCQRTEGRQGKEKRFFHFRMY